MDVYNNNIWLIEAIAQSGHRQQVAARRRESRQRRTGRQRRVSGFGEEPDEQGPRTTGFPGSGWPATGPAAGRRRTRNSIPKPGPHGFDKDYFVQQVAGLSQVTGDLMMVKPVVIDLGWGELKSALVKLTQSDFVAPQSAADDMQIARRSVRRRLPEG